MMKRVFVLVSLVVAVLVIGRNAFAHIPDPPLGPEWKLVGRRSDGTTFYVNTRSITYLPKGIVKVQELWVPRGEWREKLVNGLKQDLTSLGEDPNNAKRLWYIIPLFKFNCKTHQSALLEIIDYSFGDAVLIHESAPYEEWHRVSPGSEDDIVEKHVCNETPPSIPAQYKQTIPDPSLSSKWKLVFTGSPGTTFYFNTRRITYLPGGIVKVWVLEVPRGEDRRTFVNIFKNHLFWYNKGLNKINCKTHQYALLELDAYSFGQALLFSHSIQHEKWERFSPGSPLGAIEKYVCK